MKIEHQIIMLPSEKQQENVLCIAHGQLFFSEGLITPGGDIMPQHLYILSDEEIKQGDWFVNLGSGGHPKVAIYQANSENSKAINEFKFPEIKKIIGTTNSELHLNKIVEEDMHMYKEPLPQISQDLIKSYVENPLDKVMVEYNELRFPLKERMGIMDRETIPKLNPDGTLAVSLVEPEYYAVYDEVTNKTLHIQAPTLKDAEIIAAAIDFDNFVDGQNILTNPTVTLVEEKMYTLKDIKRAFYAGHQWATGDGKPIHSFKEWVEENL